MPEIGTSGLMRGDGKRGDAQASVLAPILDSTSVRRTTHRQGAARVHRPDPVLDHGRSGDETIRFQRYYNCHRAHAGLEGSLPEPRVEGPASPIDFGSYRWRRHCRGLYQTPIAA